MPGNTKSKGTFGKKVARGKAAVKEYATKKLNEMDSSFHIKLKHALGGVSLLSLLAAFEVFSIPAANGIINIFGLTKLFAGLVWIATAVLSGGLAIILDAEERNK